MLKFGFQKRRMASKIFVKSDWRPMQRTCGVRLNLKLIDMWGEKTVNQTSPEKTTVNAEKEHCWGGEKSWPGGTICEEV